RLGKTLQVFKQDHNVSGAYEAFRLAHSIKGAAGFLGWNRVAGFCHQYEELLKLMSEERLAIEEGLVSVVLEAGTRLKEFCEASQSGSAYSLFKVRRLEARMMQFIWAATHSDDKTHLFFGKYHLTAIEKFIKPIAKKGEFKARPESMFNKAISLPFGALVQ